ncbi:MAG: 3-dehydroquinate dehydratase, partial [Thermoleophilaceae bacterium]|nr:3-dehydroquinate dehydratase [Thermoleophilaceae bacterium]
MKNRVEVMHGVNLDMLERRPSEHYGSMSLTELEVRIGRFARELGLETTFSQTNHEGEFCELLHRAPEMADGLILNPGAWTHYSWAIRDALEIAALPAVEVHLSAVDEREEWRRQSVIGDLCV